jgi:crotonobetainyl-CoA:carnitine CoA-transferase CaiB-like acyl-CoA transferase
MTLALQGLRVLDLSRVLAGPLCTMMLGDLGADIIKVERPGTGDDTRGWGPPFDQRGESAYYLSVNRNKKSVAADLNNERDRDTILGLIQDADVVVDNFLPSALSRRGIDARRLLEEHPKLIWCTISGFGHGVDRAGYDLVVQAESGWMAITGEPEGDPMRVGVALADIIAGKDATIAIMAALVARSSARRQALLPSERHVRISLLHTATAALINVAQNALVSGVDAKRWGNQHPNLVPYQLFHAADRPMIVAVGSNAQWIACAKVLGLDDLAADTRLATNQGRLAEREKIIEAIARRILQRDAGFWIDALSAEGVPCGRVNTVIEALSAVDASALTGIAPSVPGAVRLPPPRLDEHGDMIRRDGWGAFEPKTR